MLITIVIPNRNRDLAIVRRSLISITRQASDEVQIVVVDYGSSLSYQNELKILIEDVGKVKLILCPTQQQLWNKSRAINIVLRTCTTPFFMVADMDMMFHPNFIKDIVPQLSAEKTMYFPVGILTEAESKREQPFEQYQVKFITNDEATGISIFPTSQLMEIQGFDEYYHGWGSEDTDVHVRLNNNGHKVAYQEGTCYFLHQWHPKSYRSRDSKEPYCHGLEQANARYLEQTRALKKIKANRNVLWGVMPTSYETSNFYNELSIVNRTSSVQALMKQLQDLESNSSLKVLIHKDPIYKSVKGGVKKILGKKTINFMSLEEVNDFILSALTGELRNCPYTYHFDTIEQQITFKILINR